MNTKVQATHLQRSALVYVRQSTLVQIQKNRESTLRQYDLAKRAEELGWRSEQVVVIDWNGWSSSIGTGGRHHPVRALGHTNPSLDTRQSSFL